MQKRQREFDKAAKAAQKRERRLARKETTEEPPTDEAEAATDPGDDSEREFG